MASARSGSAVQIEAPSPYGPAPAMASEPLTTEQMLTPPPIARPERVDELLRRSEQRQDDRFDLPPGDIPVPQSPVPETEVEDPE